MKRASSGDGGDSNDVNAKYRSHSVNALKALGQQLVTPATGAGHVCLLQQCYPCGEKQSELKEGAVEELSNGYYRLSFQLCGKICMAGNAEAVKVWNAPVPGDAGVEEVEQSVVAAANAISLGKAPQQQNANDEKEEEELVFAKAESSAIHRLFYGRYAVLLKKCGACEHYQRAQAGSALTQVGRDAFVLDHYLCAPCAERNLRLNKTNMHFFHAKYGLAGTEKKGSSGGGASGNKRTRK